jgi:hypothetical protein
MTPLETSGLELSLEAIELEMRTTFDDVIPAAEATDFAAQP